MSLNLHAAVRQPIQSVNPDVGAIYLQSAGNYVGPDGVTVYPAFALPFPIQAQLQPPTTQDLRHAELLNLQKNFRVVYLYSNPQALVRVSAKGGDLLMFPQAQPHVEYDQNGDIIVDVNGNPVLVNSAVDCWLVTDVPEFYDIASIGWSKLYVTLQANGRTIIVNSQGLPVLNSNGGLVTSV